MLEGGDFGEICFFICMLVLFVDDDFVFGVGFGFFGVVCW